MDIGIYGRDDYYFQYVDKDFKANLAKLNAATDPTERSGLMQALQRKIAEDYVNGYLFQLARTSVAKTGLVGLWENSPTQANDLTAVYWEE